jgi:hypothetical protein
VRIQPNPQCRPDERSPLLSAFFQHLDGFGDAPLAGLVLLGGLAPGVKVFYK